MPLDKRKESAQNHKTKVADQAHKVPNEKNSCVERLSKSINIEPWSLSQDDGKNISPNNEKHPNETPEINAKT